MATVRVVPEPSDTTRADEACGVCGDDAPPLVGGTLTGTGMTLDQAARVLLEDGRMPPALTAIQRRLVEEHALHIDAR